VVESPRVTTTAGEFQQPSYVVFATRHAAPNLAVWKLRGASPGESPKAIIFSPTEPTALQLPGLGRGASDINRRRPAAGRSGTIDTGDERARGSAPERSSPRCGPTVERAWPTARRATRIAPPVGRAFPSGRTLDRNLPGHRRGPRASANAWLHLPGNYKTGILMAPATGRVLAEMATLGFSRAGGGGR